MTKAFQRMLKVRAARAQKQDSGTARVCHAPSAGSAPSAAVTSNATPRAVPHRASVQVIASRTAWSAAHRRDKRKLKAAARCRGGAQILAPRRIFDQAVGLSQPR